MAVTEYALIAEPNRSTATALVRDLSELTNLECRVVGDGHEGHEVMFRDGTPQLLVTELTLAKRDGFSLIRGMRRLEQGRRACVVALCASGAERARVDGLRSELGPLEVVTLPYATDALRRAMRMLAATTGKSLAPPASRSGSAPPSPSVRPSPLRPPSMSSPWPSSLPPPSARPPAVHLPAPASASLRPPASVVPPALSASEGIELFARASEALPCGVLIFGADGRVVMTNSAFDALFGLQRGDVLHARRHVLISRLAHMFADPDAVLALCAEPAVGAIPVTGEIAFLRPTTRVLCWTDTPVIVSGTTLHVISCYDAKVWDDGNR